jgi:hypothetical protein
VRSDILVVDHTSHIPHLAYICLKFDCGLAVLMKKEEVI